MEKEEKASWGYFISILVFIELGIDLSLKQSPLHWQIVRPAFIILNVSIMMYLLNNRNKSEKLNLESDDTYEVLETS